MSDQSQNPLAKHFRQPSIHVGLPSKGKYWPEGSLEIPVTGELPVFPMTTKDEITLKTPDALLNGSGIVDVVQSCIPSVKNAWAMPSIDVDALLISIRIASYDHDMDVETNCPKCKEPNKYTIDLRQALASIQAPDYEKPEEVEQLKIHLRPQTFQMSNKANMLQFEEQKILQALANENIPQEQKAAIVTQQLMKVVGLSNELLTGSTAAIIMPDGTKVTNPKHIEEFYANARSTLIKTVQVRLDAMAKDAAIKPYNVSCRACEHKFEMSVDFNYASFFAAGF